MSDAFDSQIARYFDGDLDAVERQRFERDLDQPPLKARFNTAWDARIEAEGLLALRPADPDLRDCFSLSTLQAYVAERLTPGETELVEAHLACPLCSVQVAGLRSEGVTPAIGADAPSVFDRLRDWLARPGVLVPIALAAAAIVFYVTRPPAPAEFVARGTPPTWASRVGVEFRVAGQPVQTRLPANAPIDVLVRNATAQPIWVMVFGVDAQGAIDWYFPAWTDPAADPTAVRVLPGETRLPEAVAFDRPAGRYRLAAWFTQAPSQVKAVEAFVHGGGVEGLIGGHVQILDLDVQR